MKFRLLDRLACIHCSEEFSIEVGKILNDDSCLKEPAKFSCKYYCARFNLKNPKVSNAECGLCSRMIIDDGRILCKRCNVVFKINGGVPDFRGTGILSTNTIKDKLEKETDRTYSFIWNSVNNESGIVTYHFDKMQAVIPEEIVRGEIGLELGCGFGLDTWLMSGKKPYTQIIAIDISDGVYKAQHLNRTRQNVHIVRGSILKLPFRSDSFDFCYSYGVIHHTTDSEKCLKEMFKVLRSKGKAFLYLYEDHKDSPWKRYPVKLVTLIRRVSSKLNRKLLYFLSLISSPAVFVFFTLPAIMLRGFKKTRKIAGYIPFNFAKSPFSLTADLYDRFSAPIERRFNKQELYEMLSAHGFFNIKVTKLKDTAGWVVWANKKE